MYLILGCLKKQIPCSYYSHKNRKCIIINYLCSSLKKIGGKAHHVYYIQSFRNQFCTTNSECVRIYSKFVSFYV